MSNTLPPSLVRKHWDSWFLNSSKSKTCLKFHETWHAIMERHQHVVVNFLSNLGQVWVYASHKPEILTTSMMVFGRERPTFEDKTVSIASYCFQFFSHVNIEQQECCVNFCEFLGFFWTFLWINWVLNAFMCIIQFWTTCTCSSAYKLVEKSNLCPWVHA